MTGRGVVVVFRLQLFKPSETFITAQAGALRRYQPIHVGWRLFAEPPPGAHVHQPSSKLDAVRLFLLGKASGLEAQLVPGATLVHAHFGVDAVFALALARRLQVPLLVTLHGFDVSRRRLSLLLSMRPALVLFALRWRALTRRADLFLAVSGAVAVAALARGAPHNRLRRHAIGVDVRRLRPNLAGEPGLIVLVGRLVEKKGGRICLAALQQLKARWPHARLVFVGEGPLRARLEADAARRGLKDQVSFVGAQPHPAALDWMRRASIVVVPSLTARNGDAEGLPIVLLEAAALGRPLVASMAGGVGEAVTDGQEALLVPQADAPALARALERVLGDPGLAARLGAAARRRVEAAFDLHAQTAELETIYDALVDANRLAHR